MCIIINVHNIHHTLVYYTDITSNIGAEGPVIAILFIIIMVTVTIIAVVVAVIKRLVNLHTDCTYD